jgi:hypothetical protein
MKLGKASRIAAATLGTLSAGTAFATTQPSVSGALPPEHRIGEITFVTGGIGLQEALAIAHAAKHYPLELVFVQKAGKRDEYLADVPVTIKDSLGDVVFHGRSEGPYFLASLPQGRYVVSAQWGNTAFTRVVEIGKLTQRVVFEWKNAPGTSA